MTMTTADIAQLAASVSELAAHVGNLASHSSRSNGDSNGFNNNGGGNVPPPPPATTAGIDQLKRSISLSIAKLQTMLMSPTELLQHLAYQNQLLACLQWLGEFQVLAYIPLNNSVSIEDIAELASVPKSHLSRIVRMTAAAGFLQEPQLGHIAHTELSAQFVMKPSYHDAVMFLSDTAAPAALHMVKAMQLFGHGQGVGGRGSGDSAYNLWQGTAVPFATMCEQQPQLRRQWPAYLKHVMAMREGCGEDILKSLGCFDRLDSSSSTTTTVVEVGAETTERVAVLAKQYPSLNFIVQMISRAGAVNGGGSQYQLQLLQQPAADSRRRQQSSSGLDSTQKDMQQTGHNLNHGGSTAAAAAAAAATTAGSGGVGRVTISYRAIGTPQPVHDAAIYLLDLSSIGLGRSLEQITAELRAHMEILRANSNSSLIIVSYIVPGRGAVRPEEEAMARLRDLCLFQLSNQQLIDTAQLSDLVNNIHDAMGRLAVVKKVCSTSGDVAAIEVRYRPFSSSHAFGST